IFESAFVSICAAYLFGGLAKDQIAAVYQRTSLTDPLTGVANRRGFFEIGERLLKRTRLADQPVALLMFDLDHFKAINDKFGHGTGDEVLVAFGRLATSHLRPNDLFGRIGGEEFATLLPDTTRQDAIGLAERIRAAVEASPHPLGEHAIRTTVSVGVASLNEAVIDLAGLLTAADQALYRAKKAGRNCVEALSYPAERTPLKQAGDLSIQKQSAA